MTISFNLQNGENIVSFEMECNPFNVGKTITLNVNNVSPSELSYYDESFNENVFSTQENKKETFNNKKVKILSEDIFIGINAIKESTISIEYTCEFVD